jgi:hypothetical protein
LQRLEPDTPRRTDQRACQPTLLIVALLVLAGSAFTQTTPSPESHKHVASTPSLIPLQESSRRVIASETGGAFMSGSKCDADGNLYIRKLASDRPMLGPVVKIDPDGKRVALFDPASFTDPKLGRADSFSPAPDGGLYQIAGTGGLKPQIYVIRFAADGSPASAARLDAEFEPYHFAAFPGGNLLVSGVQRDVMNKSDLGRNFTAIFADGRMVTQLSFEQPQQAGKSQPGAKGEESKTTLDLSEAEAAPDGNIYALHRSSPALVYVISPAGKIVRTLKVSAPSAGLMPNTFHVSENRLAISFWDDEKQNQTVVVLDSQTGRRIARYSDPSGLGPSFACYSADEGAFTFLQLGEQNTMEVVRAEAN